MGDARSTRNAYDFFFLGYSEGKEHLRDVRADWRNELATKVDNFIQKYNTRKPVVVDEMRKI